MALRYAQPLGCATQRDTPLLRVTRYYKQKAHLRGLFVFVFPSQAINGFQYVGPPLSLEVEGVCGGCALALSDYESRRAGILPCFGPLFILVTGRGPRDGLRFRRAE